MSPKLLVLYLLIVSTRIHLGRSCICSTSSRPPLVICQVHLETELSRPYADSSISRCRAQEEFGTELDEIVRFFDEAESGGVLTTLAGEGYIINYPCKEGVAKALEVKENVETLLIQTARILDRCQGAQDEPREEEVEEVATQEEVEKVAEDVAAQEKLEEVTKEVAAQEKLEEVAEEVAAQEVAKEVAAQEAPEEVAVLVELEDSTARIEVEKP